MKFTDFEGGVRSAAFASGGLIPATRRGAVEPGLMHVADWLGTFCKLAGCDAHDPAAGSHSFPDVDSVDQLWTVLNGTSSLRQSSPLPLSSSALILWPHKLVLGKQGGKGVWTGPKHPNKTKLKDNDGGCGSAGCLFDINADPMEHDDIGRKNPELLKKLSNTLTTLKAGFWQSEANIKGGDKNYPKCKSMKETAAEHNNFAAPVCVAG